MSNDNEIHCPKRLPLAFSEEPFTSLSQGGPVLDNEVPEVMNLSRRHIDLFIAAKAFPKAKCTPGLPRYYVRKKLVAFRWAINHDPKWMLVAKFILED